MKKALWLIAVLPLLLTACDTGTTSNPPVPAVNGEPAPAAPAAPAHGYQEHEIFNDRHSSTAEIVYVSPVDGKTMICTVHRTGTGAGTSCRVKE